MNIPLLVIADCYCAIGMAIVFVAVFFNRTMNKSTSRQFYCLLAAMLVELVFYNGELFFAGLLYPTVWRVLMAALDYTMQPVLILIVLRILTQGRHEKIVNIFTYSVIGLNTVISFSAFFSDIAYSYNEYNTFIRGPIGAFSYVFVDICLVAVLVFVVVDKLRYDIEVTTPICALVTVSGGMLLNMFSDYYLLSKATFAFAIVFVYLHFQFRDNNAYYDLLQEKIRVDAPTKVLNRVAYMDDMSVLAKRTGSAAVIYADVNGLKTTNDKFGHEAGDALILRAVGYLKKYCRTKNDNVYRVGGDEFVMIWRNASKETYEERLASFRAELQSDWILSIGGAWFENVGDVDSATKQAEKAMYEDKTRYYAAHPEIDRRTR